MSYDVRHYRLPDEAPVSDRATLALWKAWATWIRPVLFATVLMVIASAIAGTSIARSGGHVAVWSPANYSGFVSLSGEAASPEGEWTRGLIAQAVAVLVAMAVAFPVLKRSLHPAMVGALSGFIVVALHLTWSRQWSLEPIAGATAPYQLVAVVALWVLPVAAAAAGALIRRSSSGGTR